MLDERRADLCNYRMKNSEDSLTVAKDCLEKGLYRDAINRSYYAAFYAIKALLALEEVDFKNIRMWLLISIEPMLRLKKSHERLDVSWHACNRKEKKVTMMIFILPLKKKLWSRLKIQSL